MTIRDLLQAKAHALAEDMGVPATILHLQAAAHHLTVELRRELDALVADFRPAGVEIAPAPAAEMPAQDPEAADAPVEAAAPSEQPAEAPAATPEIAS